MPTAIIVNGEVIARGEGDPPEYSPPPQFVYSDGGRRAAGYRGEAPGDCAVRAVAIAAQVPYRVPYGALNEMAKDERPRKGRARSSSRLGVYRRTLDRYLSTLGFSWTPTMKVGEGCRVHMRVSELPSGAIICRLSKHFCAVVDRVLYDTYDCSRGGTRCVYGYWAKEQR